MTGVRRSQRLRGVDPFFVVPAEGLDSDLQKPPPSLSDAELRKCSDVASYMKALHKKGGESKAAIKGANARGRGLIAAADLEVDEAVMAECAMISVSNEGGKVENAIQFALAAELPENASKVAVLRDLCNTFGGEVEVFDEWMLEELDDERPKSKKNRFTMQELNHLVGIYCSNAHQMSATMMCGVFPAHAMCNHSCEPNVEFTSSQEGRYIRMFAKKPLKKGQELHISYLSADDLEKDVEERRDLLHESFGFECICTRCLKDIIKADKGLLEKAIAAKKKKQKYR